MAKGKAQLQAIRSPPPLRRRPTSAGRIGGGRQRQPLAFGRVNLLQPSLRVGAANDPLEREAERMAERVVAMPAPQLAVPDAPPAEGAGASGEAQRAAAEDQPSTEELKTAPPVPEDHQDPEVPPQEDVVTERLELADMQEIEAGEPLDTAGDPSPAEPSGPAGDEEVARAAHPDACVGVEGGAAPADVARRVAQPGSGRPLPQAVRSFMEPRFGRDFSKVRIHDTPEDRRAAQRIGARAFTHRDHIWIGPGEDVGDRRLLAHELTHVVQQTAPKPSAAISRNLPEPTEEAGEPEVRRGYLRNKAEKYARNVPGYRLICVIIGRSPITGDRVERNAINLLGAMMSLIPGGNLLFERLQEARVLEEAFEWVSSRLSALNITWTRIKGLISDLIDYLPDWPSDVIAYAKKLFRPLVEDILTFIKDVTIKILEFIVRGALRLAGPWGERIWEILRKAGSLLGTILNDPLTFARNLFRAVIGGARQFGANIWTHIKKGLLGWLLGALRELDIQMPERLDFKGLISIGLQIVGLTYDRFRKLLVKRLEPYGERKVSYIERSVEAVKILAKEGFVGLWQRVLQTIDNFTETVVGGIQKFVIEKLIMGGLSWLAGLSNPIGGIVKVVLAIYNLIKTFLERLGQILELIETIFSSIGAIAAGRVQDAANFIERTMAAAIPIVISFLAALVPVTGIANSIRDIIKRLRGAVERAIDRLLTFVIKKGKKLLSRLIGRLNRKRQLPSASFVFGEKQHRIYAEKSGRKVEVRIASAQGHSPGQVAAALMQESGKLENPKAQAEGTKVAKDTTEVEKETGHAAHRLQPESRKENQLKGFAALEAELKEAAAELEARGRDAASFPEIDTRNAEYLFRAKEPRFPDVEGRADQYRALGKQTSQAIKEGDPAGRRYSDFYENDHIPEKQYPKSILAKIDFFSPGRSDGGEAVDRNSEKAAAPPEQKERNKPKIGQLGESITCLTEDGAELEAITLYRPVHILKKSKAPAKVEEELERARRQPDPIGAVKKVLSEEITEEANRITEVLRKDASASDEIRRNVDAGLSSLVARNASFYGLDKVEEAQKAATPGAGAEQSLSQLPMTGDEKSGFPNFLEREGRYQPHQSFDEGFGRYLEYDHVIDAAWPLHSAQLTFGEEALRGRLDAAGLEKKDEQVKRRFARLRDKRIFHARQGISSYQRPAGHAIAVYRPVHRAVTGALARNAEARPPREPADVAKKVTGNFVKPLTAYLESGNLTDLEAARAAVQADVKKCLKEKTNKHIDLIAEQYLHELRAVQAVNRSREASAQQAMLQISNRVRSSLQQARQSTDALF